MRPVIRKDQLNPSCPVPWTASMPPTIAAVAAVTSTTSDQPLA